MINSTWGLGESLVGGDVTPDRFTVGRRSLRVVEREIADKLTMTVRAAHGTRTERVPERLQHMASLTDAEASELAGYGVADRRPVRHRDGHRVVPGRRASCRSCRPARSPPDADRDPWNDSRSGNFLWTNTNVGEAIPDVMTPATWSMVQVFLSDAMATASIPPYVGYGRIGGRIYLNVSVMAALSKVVGVNEQNFRFLTEEVFGRLPDVGEDPAGEGVSAHHAGLGRAGRRARAVGGPARRPQPGRVPGRAIPQLCQQRRAEIAAGGRRSAPASACGAG